MDATSLLYLPVTDLAAHPTNLRDNLGDLDRLTASIRERGVIEPLVVVPLDTGGHRVLAGHRRLAAAAQASLHIGTDLGADVEATDVVVLMDRSTRRLGPARQRARSMTKSPEQ